MNGHRGLLHHLIITISDMKRSSLFYGSVFRSLGYELAGSDERYQDWKRWELGTPHEISVVQVDPSIASVKHVRGAVGHHHHLAFCALDRADVDVFYRDILRPLLDEGLCTVEDPPCDCPEYGEGYYATFFSDPDGLKYEFVFNPNHGIKKAKREAAPEPGGEAVKLSLT